jgi:hypothetical protein
MNDLVVDPCSNCSDTGHVCEEHPDRPWGGICCDEAVRGVDCAHGACGCGAPGMPCPTCCDSIPLDGSESIIAAFTPRHMRTVDSAQHPSLLPPATYAELIDDPAPSPCCDLHGFNCEPPSELCCHACTEARHPNHPPGEQCVLEVVQP